MTSLNHAQPDPLDGDPIIEEVARALVDFGGPNLDRAAVVRLLPQYQHFGELTAREIEAILRSFPEHADATDQPTTPPGVAAPGGGYLSGPMGSDEVEWWVL